jgi:hypothetical protein
MAIPRNTAAQPTPGGPSEALATPITPAIRRATPTKSVISSFKEASATTMQSPRLIVDVGGEEKSGKTHFGFTAPGPIYEHSFDIGNEGVIEKFQAQKRIFVAEYELELQPDEGSAQQVAEAANRVWDQFVANFRDGLHSCGQGTTLVDTGTEMWELLRLARFGKLTQVMPHQYVAVNKEMQALLRECYNHNGSTIFLTKLKPEWENYTDSTGREKGRKTGKMERTGFKDMPFQVQLVGTCERVDRGQAEGGGSEFLMTINDCRHTADVNGMVIENDFETLMGLVFADR